MSLSDAHFKRTKHACYFAQLSMASVFSLPPLLFVTFREMYGISYTLLGTLVLVNFCTQLLIDLLFTFFSRHFNLPRTIRCMPLLTALGLILYAVTPLLFPGHAFAGLVAGTVVFSVAAGLGEVLLSPLAAALPSDNPERDMSRLHSLYAYGVVGVILLSTAFLYAFGTEKWMILTLIWAVFPVLSSVWFWLSPMPEIRLSPAETDTPARKRKTGLALCVLCIFLGSAAENTMTNWISAYTESVLQLPKALGDVMGMATFAVLLGLGRSLYARYGRNISGVLLVSMVGAAVCYGVAGLSRHPALSLTACVFTGLCTAMLWPGTLILMEEKFPHPGVAAYALMAAGGDLGGSIAPQLMGAVADAVSAAAGASGLEAALALSADQIGMKAGMLAAACFPLLGVGLLIYLKKRGCCASLV